MFVIVNKKENLYWTGKYNKSNDAGWNSDINQAKTFGNQSVAEGKKKWYIDINSTPGFESEPFYKSQLKRWKDSDVKKVEVAIKLVN